MCDFSKNRSERRRWRAFGILEQGDHGWHRSGSYWVSATNQPAAQVEDEDRMCGRHFRGRRENKPLVTVWNLKRCDCGGLRGIVLTSSYSPQLLR